MATGATPPKLVHCGRTTFKHSPAATTAAKALPPAEIIRSPAAPAPAPAATTPPAPPNPTSATASAATAAPAPAATTAPAAAATTAPAAPTSKSGGQASMAIFGSPGNLLLANYQLTANAVTV